VVLLRDLFYYTAAYFWTGPSHPPAAASFAVAAAVAAPAAGASLEPKHDHARGAGHGPLAGGDEEKQRA
jgi:hypothetical protein